MISSLISGSSFVYLEDIYVVLCEIIDILQMVMGILAEMSVFAVTPLFFYTLHYF